MTEVPGHARLPIKTVKVADETYTWGIDTSLALTQKATSGPLAGTNVVDGIRKHTKGEPGFWGRYLYGPYPVSSQDELERIRQLQIPIALLFADYTIGPEGGRYSANLCADKAIHWGVPKDGTVCIYADVEGRFNPPARWYQAWCEALLSRGFIPGIYAAANVENEEHAAVIRNWEEAFNASDAVRQMLFWVYEGSFNLSPALEDASFLPHPFESGQSRQPILPHFLSNSDARRNFALWQYAIECLSGTADYNLATKRGMRAMWRPSVTTEHSALLTHNADVFSAPTRELSGAQWVNRFPTSTDVATLVEPFQSKVRSFLMALKQAGANVMVTATRRPRERAYLMHWAWHIANRLDEARNAPAMPGVDINWVHPMNDASIAAAGSMVDNYGMAYDAALNSNHILGLAIDMDIRAC